jgi:hypothetical protein
MTTGLRAADRGKGPQNAGRLRLNPQEAGYLQAFRRFSETSCDLRETTLRRRPRSAFISASSRTGERSRKASGGMAKGRGGTRKVSCEDCFFRQNLLCALPDDEPCATFRPAHPDGLRPPRQLRFQFRQERRTQSVWAFPTAQEQASLHA